MSIHAHPDDQDFTVAGTLAKWARAGCQIVTVIITDGSAGSNDPAHGPDYKPTLARIRADEQRAANAVLGVKETTFLGYPDGELTASIQLRRDLTRLIRQYKPQAVVTGDPTGFDFAFFANSKVMALEAEKLGGVFSGNESFQLQARGR